MTFDNIGWFVYLWTRLEPLFIMSWIVFAVGLMALMGITICYLVDGNEFPRWAKAIVISTASTLAILLLVPTKDDALLIAGAVVGGKVAEQTINTVSESELVGNVLQIVSERVESELTQHLKPKEVDESK